VKLSSTATHFVAFLFNIITAVVDEQSMSILEFLNACKIEQSLLSC